MSEDRGAPRRLGVTPAAYRRLEEEGAWPNFETWDRICKLYGWPQTFTAAHGAKGG